jgi:hypothetical protein
MADGVLQFAGAAMDTAAQLFFGEACEPAFHQVEPRGAGGCEVQMEARMMQQPTLDGWGFVRRASLAPHSPTSTLLNPPSSPRIWTHP